MTDSHCTMIHGGLELNFKGSDVTAQHCCLRNDKFPVDIETNFWNHEKFIPLRIANKNNTWDPGCRNCQQLENSGHVSMRQGMNSGLGIQTDLSGPLKIDLMFDISCNLACRICGANSSTFWQKHLQEQGLWPRPILPQQSYNDVIKSLSHIDLSNLQRVVFCGGETLMGQAYWNVAEWLANNVPNAQHNLFINFQTNGTQPITDKNYKTIEKLKGVRLNISLDGVGSKFEYMRWPANWNQVIDNIFKIRQTAPGNVMFLVEETISIFNLWYTSELDTWVKQNFATDRQGDLINHTKHLANGIFSLNGCSQEYVSALKNTANADLVPATWQENPVLIRNMIKNIKQFDSFRSQSFEKTFPEVAEFYHRFL